MKLKGLNTIVTGGTHGLGRVITETFLAEGANVLFCARNSAEVAAAQDAFAANCQPGQRVAGLAADISKPEDVERLFATVAAWGRLDAVVNNAGIYGPIGPTEAIDIASWNQTFQVNVTGTLLVCQAAIRAMKPHRRGKIIAVSGGGATSPMPRFAAYAASKAALVRLMETLAEECRPDGLEINAIAPGALHTRMTEQVLAAGPGLAGAESYARNKKWAEGGAADPKVAAALCVFLAGAEGHGITGKLLSAQWDPWSKLPAHREHLKSDIYTLRRIVPQDRGHRWGEEKS